MNTIRKKTVLACGLLALVAAVAVGIRQPVAAQETAAAGMKTMVVVSLSGYDELVSDVQYIGKLIDRPGLDKMLEGGLAMMTGGKGVTGLDRTKPWGAVVQTDGAQFPILGFLPVKDFKQVLEALAPFAGQPADLGGGVYEFKRDERSIYLKQQNGWAFLAPDETALKSLPKDPVALLDGLDKQYDLAVRLNVQNIPRMFRDMAVEQLKMGVELGLARQEDESDEQYELRKKIVENQMKSMTTLVEDTDQVTLGWKVDSQAGNTSLVASFTAMAGSKFAKQAAQLRESKSNFAGFQLPEAAVTFNVTTKSAEQEDIDQALVMVDAVHQRADKAIEEDSDLPDDAARDTVKSAVDDIVEVVKATIKEGIFDAGGAVKLDPEALTIALGGKVADGPGLEKAFKKLAELAKDEPGFQGVNWDAEKYEGIRFHTMRVPVPDGAEEEARQLFGEQLDVVVGVGAKSFYLAFGKEGLSTLKAAIDKSKADAERACPPMQLAVSVGKIMKFAAAQDDDPTKAMIAEVLDEEGAADHVKLVVEGIPNGFLYRLEAGKSVLKAIGKAGAATTELGGEL